MKTTKATIQSEALKIILPLQRCGVGMSVGTGKTLLGLQHMVEHYTDTVMFLVVAPKKSIWQSWIDDANKFDLDYLIPHIKFTTYLSLPKKELYYDVAYLDECHSLKESCEPWLNAFKGKILGLTGTPPKFERSEKGRLVGAYCPIVYKYTTDTAIDDKILNDYQIIVHPLMLNEVKNIPMHKNGATWFTSERASYDYWTNRLNSARTPKEVHIMRIMRMKALQGLGSKEIYTKKLAASITAKLIIFADTQEQAERLCLHSYHSNNPNSEQNLEDFKKGNINKLSCVLQLSEGINIPELKAGILLHSYGNERKSSQRIGRLLRLNPNDKAVIHVLYYQDTVDEQWVKQALEGYDKTKVKWL